MESFSPLTQSSLAETASASRPSARLWISCSGRIAWLEAARSSPIDEQDFFERRYLAGDGVPILVELEVVLTDLTEDVLDLLMNKANLFTWPVRLQGTEHNLCRNSA